MKKLKTYALLFLCLTLCCCTSVNQRSVVESILKDEIIRRADSVMALPPVTVTAAHCERSAGGVHDFYSEGDYWWPDSLNPEGKYVRRDGQSNPDNFVAHRQAMVRFSTIVGTLTSAYLLTGDTQYAKAVIRHADAWFINPHTCMSPHLLYAQAIKGVTTGRGVGIIDTVHLMEVAQSLLRLKEDHLLPEQTLAGTVRWFSDYLEWLYSHPYGIKEMNAKNNHATCWVMQVAAFARYVGNEDILADCRKQYKERLLPHQMADDGSFPLELARTKPYGYSLFNLDAMATLCHILTSDVEDLWHYTIQDKNVSKGIDYIFPYVKNKKAWPLSPDIMYWDEWPIAHTFLIFGAVHNNNQEWLNVWKGLEHFPETEEVIRNFPVRNPLIWMD